MAAAVGMPQASFNQQQPIGSNIPIGQHMNNLVSDFKSQLTGAPSFSKPQIPVQYGPTIPVDQSHFNTAAAMGLQNPNGAQAAGYNQQQGLTSLQNNTGPQAFAALVQQAQNQSAINNPAGINIPAGLQNQSVNPIATNLPITSGPNEAPASLFESLSVFVSNNARYIGMSIVLLAILIAAAYFVYNKYYKKSPGNGSNQPPLAAGSPFAQGNNQIPSDAQIEAWHNRQLQQQQQQMKQQYIQQQQRQQQNQNPHGQIPQGQQQRVQLPLVTKPQAPPSMPQPMDGSLPQQSDQQQQHQQIQPSHQFANVVNMDNDPMVTPLTDANLQQ